MIVKGTWMEEDLTVSTSNDGGINFSIDHTFDHDITITKEDAINIANHILELCKSNPTNSST